MGGCQCREERKLIAVVDYKKGNLLSVERGLRFVGAPDALITADPAEIARAQAVVLPGVGAFADAAASMRELGQMEPVRNAIVAGVPFLGICLGFQLMYEGGAEGAPAGDDEVSSHKVSGLAVLPGVVDRMPHVDARGTFYKVPHVGWNTIELATNDCPLFADVGSGEYFYFTHSYVAPESPCTIARTTHSVTFPCAAQYGDVAFGVQFHPEKSSDAGMAVLQNFIGIVKAA